MGGTTTGHVIAQEHRSDEPIPGSQGWVRVMIDDRVGARNVLQRFFRFGTGRTPELRNESSEDVMYVVAGIGTAHIGEASYDIAPGTAVFVPPGVGYALENPGPHDLEVVSVLSPPPGIPRGRGADIVSGEYTFTAREEERPAERAGEGRWFQILIDPRHGCRNVTQFVGRIGRTAAPPHRHRYEEAIYVLEGEGVVDVAEEALPVSSGDSIFLPPGVPHRIKPTGPEGMKLLGVFSPAGSPASKEDLPA